MTVDLIKQNVRAPNICITLKLNVTNKLILILTDQKQFIKVIIISILSKKQLVR